MNPNSMIFVVTSMTFAAVLLLIQSVYFWVKGRRDDEANKIAHRLGVDRMMSEEEEALASLLREQATDSTMDALGAFGKSLDDMIKQSGLDSSVTQLVVQMLVLGIIGVSGIAFFFGPQFGIFGLPFGYAPYWWVNRAATNRAKAMVDQLPDGLEMMGRAMQAGAGLVDGFRLVQDEMSAPLSEEFGRVADEIRFGKEWRDALAQLISRNPSLFELRLLVSSVLLQRETGGNLIETVNRISKLIRARTAFDGKVKAMTSEARASGLVLAFMPLGVLVMIMMANAPYLDPLRETAMGQMVIVYAVSSYGLGIFIMRSASTVEA